MATLYDKLGVQPNATVDEIKRAYRKAAMRWHPDRNAGAEEAASVAFQDIKDAYGILSDPDQRKVYDNVFAQQMRAWESQQQRRQRERAKREEAARAAEQEAYAKMVSLAMRFAEQGHNRDVVFGVLLGHKYEAVIAGQVADSVVALHASRQPQPGARQPDAQEAQTTPAAEEKKQKQNQAEQKQEEQTPSADHAKAASGNTLGGLWFQFLNGLRF